MAQTAVINPNYGLYFDRTSLAIPSRGLADGRNFRVSEGKLTNVNLGWTSFNDINLGGPVRFIDNFFPRNSDEHLIFGTDTDVFVYNATTVSVAYITPILDAAATTASASGTAVTGIGGTTWQTDGVKAGDFIAFGAYGEDDPTEDWFEIATVVGETSLTLVEDAGTVGAGAYTIRRTFTGTSTDVWSFDTFVQDSVSGDDLWIATNGVEDVVSWNGTGFLTLNALGFKCKAVKTFSNMMIYMALTQGGEWLPSSIINSDVGKPLDVVSGLSEQFRIHDGVSQIYAAYTLGENLAFYCDRHNIVLAQFVGDPTVFLFREIVNSPGVLGPNAVADFGDFHEFVGTDAFYTFDGSTVKEVNSHVWRYVIRQTDAVRRTLIRSHFDEERGDVIWSVPSTSDDNAGSADVPPQTAWGEHYLEAVPDGLGTPFSVRDFPFTASGYYSAVVGATFADFPTTGFDEVLDAFNAGGLSLGFPLNLVGDQNGNIWIINTSQTGDGNLLPSFVKTGRMALGSGRERSVLARIYPFAEQFNNTLTVSVFMADHAAKDATAAGNFAFDTTLNVTGSGEHFVSVFRRGRFTEWTFGTPGQPWTLWGWDYDLRKASFR